MAAEAACALTGLELHEVSLVDRGAVRRKFALTKRHGAQNMAGKARKDDGAPDPATPAGADGGGDDGSKVLERLLQTPMSNEADIQQALSGLSPEAQQAAVGAFRILSGYADQFGQADWQTLLGIASGNPAPTTTTDPADKQTSHEGTPPPKGPDAGTSPNPDPKLADPNKPDEEQGTMTDTTKAELARLEKSHKDEIARIEKAANERAARAEAKTEAIEKALEKERDEADTRACVQKAAEQFPNCGESAVIGALLKNAKGKDREALETHLRATEARLASSDLFKTAGHARTNPSVGTAVDELNKATQEVMKAHPKLKWSQAMDRAMKSNPALYARYEAEKAAR